MSDKPKSILDDIPVDDKAFPLNKPEQGEKSFEGLLKAVEGHQLPSEPLVVVGNCPTCDSPIYGRFHILPGETPQVTRSCKCHEWLGKRRTT